MNYVLTPSCVAEVKVNVKLKANDTSHCSRNERKRQRPKQQRRVKHVVPVQVDQPWSSKEMNDLMLQLPFLETESTKCVNLNPNLSSCMLVCDGQPLPCNVVEDIINLFIKRSKAFFYGIDQVSK